MLKVNFSGVSIAKFEQVNIKILARSAFQIN